MEDTEKDVPDKGTEGEESPEDSSSKEEIDYEAELEAERQRGKPDPEKAKQAFKEREEKRKNQNPEEKPLTRKDLEEILVKQSQDIRKETQFERISSIAHGMSESEAEANLIMEVHKNRTFPTGMPLQEQLEEAYLIANKKKLAAQNSELARALKSKETASKETATIYRDGQKSESMMPETEKASYQRAGFTFDTKDKLWKKKLPNGKSLVKNPITKQSRVI